MKEYESHDSILVADVAGRLQLAAFRIFVRLW